MYDSGKPCWKDDIRCISSGDRKSVMSIGIVAHRACGLMHFEDPPIGVELGFQASPQSQKVVACQSGSILDEALYYHQRKHGLMLCEHVASRLSEPTSSTCRPPCTDISTVKFMSRSASQGLGANNHECSISAKSKACHIR